MMAQSVDLEPHEWQQVISALAMTNPVLVKISSQLAKSQQVPVAGIAPAHSGNSSMKEPSHGL